MEIAPYFVSIIGDHLYGVYRRESTASGYTGLASIVRTFHTRREAQDFAGLQNDLSAESNR